MALPNNGLLTFQMVIAEFGRPNNKSLSQYYGVAPGIPTSGELSLSMFYGKSNSFSFTISANSIRPNIRQLATNAGWNGAAALICNITAPLINTLDLGTTPYPNGLLLNIGANTLIGGVRGGVSGTSGIGGQSGFPALITRIPVMIDNRGRINGGGGGGSAGSDRWVRYGGSSTRYTSNDGFGGSGQGFFGPNDLTVFDRGFGSSATEVMYPGAVLGGQTKPYAQGGSGGDGGVWGVAGKQGSYVTREGGSYSEAGTDWYPAPAGQPGASVDGNSHVQWVNYGVRNGPLIN